MIDHVSIGVRDLQASRAFYEAVLAALGMELLVERAETVGFGKRHPEFWLNARPGRTPTARDTGGHVCLRAARRGQVDAAHRAALEAGGSDDGPPGPRPEYSAGYYAAFFRDADGNRIEVVNFAARP